MGIRGQLAKVNEVTFGNHISEAF